MNRRPTIDRLLRWWQALQRPTDDSDGRSSSYLVERLEARLVLTGSPFEPVEFSNISITEHMAVVAGQQTYVANELVVAFRNADPVTSMEELLAGTDWPAFYDEFSFNSIEQMFSLDDGDHGQLSLWHFTWSSNHDAIDYLDDFGSLAAAEWAAPNFVYESEMDLTPNDPDVGSQYHHTVMQNYSAWDTTVGSPNIIVAVTDSGFDWDHPDLDDNIWTNTDEIAGNGIDDDNNGYIDDIRGWDFVSNDNNPDESSSSSHGTHVAGIVAAEIDNATGVAGTAGGVTMMPLRIGSGPTSTRYAGAFTYAADNGAHIANTSFSVDSRVGDPVYRAALRYMYDAGVLHFNSAGNNDELDPPRQDMHESLFVASTNSTDGRSGFTNYGIGIDVSAPGSSVLSTEPNGTYGTKSGTSMAAPNAAGAAALIWSANPTWTRDQVAAQLLGTADAIDNLNPGYEGLLGSGRVNSNRALNETLAPPVIENVTELPSSGGVTTQPISTLTVELANIFDKASIDNIGNWELRSDGADNTFGNADDYIVPLTLVTEYLIGTNDLEFSVGGPLAQEHYRFRAVSGGLADPFGTALDGNGDGTAGDDFFVEFTVAAPDMEWETLEPFGGLVSTFTTSDFLLAVPTGTEFTGYLLDGQALTFEASPSSGAATLTVTVENSGGVIATATANSAGAPVSMQNIDLASADNYTVRVTSDVDTDFDLEVFRNATVEFIDSSDGSELAIDDSGLQVGSTRYAAVGTIETGGDVDEYTLDLPAGTIDVVVAGIDGTDLSSATIELIDTDGTSVLVAASDQPLGITAENYDQAIIGFAVPLPGQYTIRIDSSAAGTYGLVVTEGVVFDSEPNGPNDPLRSLDDTAAAIGFLNVIPIDGTYVFNLNPTESDLTLSGDASGIPFTEQAPGSLSSTIDGTIRAGLTSSTISFIGGSEIDVTETPGTFLPGDAPADFAAQLAVIVAAARDIMADVSSGQTTISSNGEFSVTGMNIELSDGTFAYEVPGLVSDTLSVGGFSALNESTEMGLIEVLPNELKLTVPIEATIALEEPDLGLVVNATLTGIAVGFVSLPASQDADDSYTIDLVEGQTVSIATQTPFDTASGSILTNLDPLLTIYDPLGGLVVADDNSAADGRNASITFTVGSTGTFRIEVGAGSGAGTYVLDVDAGPAVNVMAPTTGVRGELLDFTFTAIDAGPTSAADFFDYSIDWDGDDIVDETVTGSSILNLQHAYASDGAFTVKVTATDMDGLTGAETTLPVVIDVWQLRPDKDTPSLTNLIWGGTSGDDQIEFEQVDPTTVLVRVPLLDGVPTSDAETIPGVTGKVIGLGGLGNDQLDGRLLSGTVVQLVGGAGEDILHGTEGDDELFGDYVGGPVSEIDEIFGYAGEDLIQGDGAEGAGASDTIYGGDDADLIYGDGGDGAEGAGDVIFGGDGDDIIYADGAEGGLDADDMINGGEGNDTIYADGAEGGDDTVFGEAGDDFIDAGEGNNIVDGGANNDIIIAAVGNDMLNGGAGIDLLVGGAGEDAIDGGSGQDLLIAGSIDLDATELQNIQAEWTSGKPLTERIDNILGHTSGGLNGTSFLVPGNTVLDDEAVDSVLGNIDEDLLLYDFGEDGSDYQAGVDHAVDIGP